MGINNFVIASCAHRKLHKIIALVASAGIGLEVKNPKCTISITCGNALPQNEETVQLPGFGAFTGTLAIGDCAQIVQQIILMCSDCLVTTNEPIVTELRPDLSSL